MINIDMIKTFIEKVYQHTKSNVFTILVNCLVIVMASGFLYVGINIIALVGIGQENGMAQELAFTYVMYGGFVIIAGLLLSGFVLLLFRGVKLPTREQFNEALDSICKKTKDGVKA